MNAPASDVQNITAALGPAALAASKAIYCSANKCVIAGMNSSPIANGVVAVLSLQLSSSATGNLAVQLSNTSAASPQGSSMPVSTVDGEVSVNAPSVSVSVSPASVTLASSKTQQFTAAVTGTTNTAVTWSMSPQVGQLSTTGLYTAPSTIASGSTVKITATSSADPTKSANATITLQPPQISMQVVPVAVHLKAGQSQQYTVTITGISDTSVTWSIAPAIGSISSSGVYAAPASITANQVVAVTAHSNAVPWLTASTYLFLAP